MPQEAKPQKLSGGSGAGGVSLLVSERAYVGGPGSISAKVFESFEIKVSEIFIGTLDVSI